MNTIRIDGGISLAYERCGSGTPLLLIAGLGCDKRFWRFQIQAFSVHHEVIAFDNRGIGESDKPEGPYSITQMADDAATLLSALGIDRAHILGASMGGMIALEFAIRHPKCVRSLIVTCGIDRANGWMKAKQVFNQKLSMLSADEKSLRELIARLNILWMFSPTFYDQPERVNQALQSMQEGDQPLDAYRWQSQALHDHDATHGLGAIKCPTLVMVGKEDLLTPIRYAEAIVDAIPNAELKILNDCGHLFMVEKPDQFNEAVLDFLEDVDLRESVQLSEDEPFEIPLEQGQTLCGLIRRAPEISRWALLCRGLTGNLSRRSSLDELADALERRGWSSFRFDYRGRGTSLGNSGLPTVESMVKDVSRSLSSLWQQIGRLPDVVIVRGFGARLALEALVPHPDVPLVLWAPILWLQTSLELRGRMHELRRNGCLIIDGTELGANFLESLQDPTDDQVRSWIVPQRRHVIIQTQEDQVVPVRFGKELHELIESASGRVDFVTVPGTHPHPGVNVRTQIRTIGKILADMNQN